MEKPQIICHLDKSCNYSVFDARWIPSSAKFVVLGSHPKGTGALQIYEINGTEVNLIREVDKGKAFKCGTFGASSLKDRHLATGDFEGKLQIWNLEDFTFPLYSVKAHNEIINCIDGIGGLNISTGAPEIVTGSRDGLVKVWDPRLKEVPVATMEPAQGEKKRDCWCVSFGNSYNNAERTVCAGYDNGDIKLFDLKQLRVLWEANLKNGVCSVDFDRKDIPMNKLVATTLESKFYVFDLHVQHPKTGYPHLMEKQKHTFVCHTKTRRDRENLSTDSESAQKMPCGSPNNVSRTKSLLTSVIILQYSKHRGSLNKELPQLILLVMLTLIGLVYPIRAHKSTIWACKHLPQNREVFMTCGGTGSLCLWKYNYPSRRTEKDSDGIEKGVIGSLELLQNATVSTQPISSFDWSPDKLGLAVCTGLDQAFRVLITTKLHLL